MSGYKGHIAGAAVFGSFYIAVLMLAVSAGIAASISLNLEWQHIALLLVVAMLFGIWPDIDTNSKAQDLFMGATFVIDAVLIVAGHVEVAAYVGLAAMLPIVGKHRGWTHSFWAMFLVPLPILVVPYLYNPQNWRPALVYYGAAVIGYFSHLFFDGRVSRAIKRHAH